MEILHRSTRKCLFKANVETIRELVERAVAQKTDLSEADLREADLSGAGLGEADLSWAHLSGADLSEAHLLGAYLREADLSRADLRGTSLRGADLRRADLSWAHLGEADLSRADLRGARLSGADLREARLSGAHLSGADLSWADLLKRLYWELHALRLQRASPKRLWATFNLYLTSSQLCHEPSEKMSSLCGCEKTYYVPNACLHFTVGDCREDEMIYCIPYDDPFLSIREHKKGECPYTEYERVK